MTNIPILIIYFNRPDALEINIAALVEAGVSNLYIARDGIGPNVPHSVIDEVLKCDATVDKNSYRFKSINRLINNFNIGCDQFVPKALDWAFESEDFLIILEDDCIIDINFIEFCKSLSRRYQEDFSVGSISASCFLPSDFRLNNSFYMSKYPSSWGWATWKSRWVGFAEYRENIFKSTNQGTLGQSSYLERLFWWRFKNKLLNGSAENWDAIWLFFNSENNRYHITPAFNMCTNIGWGSDAVHTKIKDERMEQSIVSYDSFLDLNDLTEVSISNNWDKHTFSSFYWPGFQYFCGRIWKVFA